MNEKQKLSATTLAFISCRVELRVKLGATRSGSVQTQSEHGKRAGCVLVDFYSGIHFHPHFPSPQ
jgi:hypothetical protein